MARPIEIDPENGDSGATPGDGSPGDPGYSPPTSAGTAIAFTVSGTSALITATQIMAAGGPWAKFTVRVTPFNKNGSGPSATYSTVPAISSEGGAPIQTEDGQTVAPESN